MTAHFRDSTSSRAVRITESETISSVRRFGFYRVLGKRAFDIFFVVAVAPVGLLLVGFAALMTALGGQSPFYIQRRIGKGGRVFRMLKIRTMVSDADVVLETYLARNPAARKEWDEKQKLENDPRITRFGDFLRKTSLDEMPQLWNVLKGDMSIVGPRPMMVDQQRLYPGRAYFALRPGITGNWQVSDRNECSFAARAGFDDAYEARLSLKMDLEILVRTAGVVLHCTGR